jgi:dTDP-glucose 4,6-dehydratase
VRQSQKRLFDLPDADVRHILHTAAADLATLRGKRLFITGGTGFFGKWLLGALLHANAEMDLRMQLTVLSRAPEVILSEFLDLADVPGLRFVVGDIAEVDLAREEADIVLHAAADTTAVTNEHEERLRTRTIVDGTRRVLDLAQRCEARLLYVSSGAVYGAAAAQRTGAREEDFPEAQAVMTYGASKREAERLCAESGADFVTARAFAFLGPYLPLDAHFAAGNFLRDALRGGPILVRGDGTALRSYLHPADLVVWLLRVLARGERARAYNVGSDQVVSTAELARMIAEAVAPRAEVIVQAREPQGPQNIYLPNVDRARRELGLRVDIPLREAITRTLAFLAAR